MPMGTGLINTTDPYLAGSVTDEMRNRGPQGLLENAIKGFTGVDVKQTQGNINQGIDSLGDRLKNVAAGVAGARTDGTLAPVVQGSAATSRPRGASVPSFDPREMDALSAPTNALTNRNAPNFGMEPTSYDPAGTVTNIPGPGAMPEEIRSMRDTFNDLGVFGPNTPRAPVTIEGPIGRRYDLPSEELDAISRNYEIDGVTGPTPEEIDGFTPQPYGPDMDANASYRGSRATPMNPDMTVAYNPDATDPRGDQFAPTPGEGYGVFGPRTPDDLRAMGIEPTTQDLMDMQLSPAEILREQNRGRDTSYQGTGLPSDLRNADSVGATAASTSLENFFEQNPDLGASLMNSREGAELNDIMRFGGFDKSQPIQTFVDPETAEIKVQGYDARTGGAKGFNIDASEFFGKQSFGEVLLDTLQAGGVEKLADESLAEKARRQNREFQEEKARREREGRSSINTLEQGLGNINYRG